MGTVSIIVHVAPDSFGKVRKALEALGLGLQLHLRLELQTIMILTARKPVERALIGKIEGVQSMSFESWHLTAI